MTFPNPCDKCSATPTSTAPLVPIPTLHQSWHKWRAISDKIVSHPNYRYGAPGSKLLIKLARFAHTQMAIFNNRQWSTYSNSPDFTGQFDGHFDRAKDRKVV